MGLSYKEAGVDVQAGYEAVRLMKGYVEKTFTVGVLGGLGGFGGCFELPKGYSNPVLVSGTDSVGTKLKIAYASNKHTTVGIDCVAMCVNDIICQGAKPLFFLDYIGIGQLEPEKAAALVQGVSAGCLQAGCALVGGETAELPGIYQPDEYDLAGFAVGIVEKDKLITGAGIVPGDAVIGFASSGLHSNGFSLVRKILLEDKKLDLNAYIPELNGILGDVLLTPTKIYAPLMEKLTEKYTVKAAAHITGGGWVENIPRMAGERENIRFMLKTENVPLPPVFEYLKSAGNLSDMYNTFNMGVGFALTVAASDAAGVIETARAMGETACIIGETAARKPGEGAIHID